MKLNKTLMLTFFLLTIGNQIYAQKKITTPIEGIYGKDYIIVNYVDWGFGDTVKDLNCGSKTYNGHQGTDFVIRNYKQMDSGVAVLASDTGIVIDIIDGLFDKETLGDTSKKLGNYIAIAHNGKFYSYYGHLKKNSILVKKGDTVLPGQKIAEVGSSGNSTDPHLHFEWWYDSTIFIDPFAGVCGNNYTYFSNPDPYDTSFHVWQSGLFNDTLNLEAVKKEPKNVTIFNSENDSFISYWNLMYGLRTGDKIAIEWYAPDNSLWFDYSITMDKGYWFYQYWTYINTPKISGKWNVILYRNGIEIDTYDFTVNAPTSHINKDKYANAEVYYNSHKIFVNNASETTMKIYTISGILLMEKTIQNNQEIIPIKDFPSQIFIMQLTKNNQLIKTIKVN